MHSKHFLKQRDNPYVHVCSALLFLKARKNTLLCANWKKKKGNPSFTTQK